MWTGCSLLIFAHPSPPPLLPPPPFSPFPSGLSFQQLYSRCRSRFIVSNEVTLRAHLRELSDHELVKAGRQADGADVLVVALPRDAVTSVLADL